jgi:hypothetical protein
MRPILFASVLALLCAAISPAPAGVLSLLEKAAKASGHGAEALGREVETTGTAISKGEHLAPEAERGAHPPTSIKDREDGHDSVAHEALEKSREAFEKSIDAPDMVDKVDKFKDAFAPFCDQRNGDQDKCGH